MRKLIAWNVMSLDGYLEGGNPWVLDFHQSAWGREVEATSLQQAADIVVLGRKTYQGMKEHWEQATGEIADFINAVPKRIASRSLKAVAWRNAALIGADVVSFLRQAKSETSNNIYVFGSAELLDTLLAHGLVDEYRICVAPVVLGTGTPLFKRGMGHNLKLIEARALNSGGIFARFDINAGRIDSALRLINAPASTIYSALIDAQAMAQWRPPADMTGEVLEVDPREGGRFRMALHYGDPAKSGKSGDGSDVFESRFIRLEPDREVTEAIAFQSENPAFSGTMLMSTCLRPVGASTEVSIIARDVPEGIGQEDHLSGLNSTLANLDRFCPSA